MSLGLKETNLILQNALRNTFQELQLANEYNNILQTNISLISANRFKRAIDQYELISSSYARTPRSIPEDQIVEEARVILEVIGKDLTSAELAEILNLNVTDIEKALCNTSKKSYKVENTSSSITSEDLKLKARSLKTHLIDFDWVQAIGVHNNTEAPCLYVYVNRKTKVNSPDIPKVWEGIPVKVQHMGKVRPAKLW